MSNPYESPKTNDEASQRKPSIRFLSGLLFAGLVLGGVLAYVMLLKQGPSMTVTPLVTPAQQPIQAEPEN